MNLGWGGQEFEIGGSKHYHGGGGGFLSTPRLFFLIQVGGSVNEVGGSKLPPAKTNTASRFRIKAIEFEFLLNY